VRVGRLAGEVLVDPGRVVVGELVDRLGLGMGHSQRAQAQGENAGEKTIGTIGLVTAANGWHKQSFELLDFREPLWRKPPLDSPFGAPPG